MRPETFFEASGVAVNSPGRRPTGASRVRGVSPRVSDPGSAYVERLERRPMMAPTEG